jgi:hypothetical protein
MNNPMTNFLQKSLPPKRNVTPVIDTIYHATSETVANRILSGEGIVPRSKLGTTSRYSDFPSNPECVYLTYSHGAFFAGSVAGGSFSPTDDCTRGSRMLARCAILEIDGKMLKIEKCYPDEDYLEQSGRNIDSINGNIFNRTDHYRSRMFDFSSRHAECFATVGSIAYRELIPVTAIKRVAFINWDNINDAVLMKMYFTYFQGNSPSLDDYTHMGATHRELTELFFGDRSTVNGERLRLKKGVTVVKNKRYRKR